VGVLSRLLRRADPRPAPEARFTVPWGDGWGGAMALGNGRAAGTLNPAERLGAVLSCIELITGAIASLPPSITADDGAGGQVAAPPTATAWALLRRPNRWQSWPAFMACMASSVLTQGNALAYMQRDGRGAVTALVWVPWPWVTLQVIQGAAGAPRLVYDLLRSTPETLLLGLPGGRMLDSDILHVRGRSDEGIIGRSVLSRAAGVVQEATEVAATSEALFRNGMSMSGFVETGGVVLTDPQRDRFKASLQEFRGSAAAGKTMLLEGPFKYTALSVTPADAELLATRAFTVGEIARLFCVPEPLLLTAQRAVPDLAPFLAAFATLALSPLVNALEAEFADAVLPRGMNLQLDMAGLMRGSFSGQVAAFATATQSGITTPNDARRGLGLPAHADGDLLRPAGVPSFPADAAGVPSLAPKPGHTGDGLPATGTHQNAGAA
jgi:HK97 family phage portal protein